MSNYCIHILAEDIFQNISLETLQNSGFQEYFTISAADLGNRDISAQMKPPRISTQIFIGCGNSSSDEIDLDAVFLEGTKLLYKI